MAETHIFKAGSSQNGSSGVAASSATNFVGMRVLFKQYSTGLPCTGTIMSMQGDHAFISQDGLPAWLPQHTDVSDIMGCFSSITAPSKAAAATPSKAAAVAPSKAAAAAPSKAAVAAPSKEAVAAPSKAAATPSKAAVAAPSKAAAAVSEEAFPELKATEAQLNARASPPKAATVPKTAAAVPKTAAPSKAAGPKVSKRVLEEEIGDFVAATAADACVRAQLTTLLDHTMSGRKTVKFGFPATLRFDDQHVSVGANFNKPYVLEKLRENLGIESDKIRVSINYAFEHLPNGKLDVLKMGEITIFVSW